MSTALHRLNNVRGNTAADWTGSTIANAIDDAIVDGSPTEIVTNAQNNTIDNPSLGPEAAPLLDGANAHRACILPHAQP